VKREGHQYVHAVLLNDPVWRINRRALRQIKFRYEPEYFDYWDAPEAIGGRQVRVVYTMSFQPDDEDDACPECKLLMSILQLDPEQYPEHARRISQQVQERERRQREKREKAQEKRGKAQHALRHLLDGADESDEDEPSPDLMELLKRERNDSDASDTA
jgi:hypothetical protein